LSASQLSDEGKAIAAVLDEMLDKISNLTAKLRDKEA